MGARQPQAPIHPRRLLRRAPRPIRAVHRRGPQSRLHSLRWAQLGDLEVPAFTAAIEAHQRRITEAILDHSLRICSEKNVKVETKVIVGDPKEKICEFVENLQADLLVIGSRAFGPIKRMFLGSVSNHCTNHVQCPVIIVKGKGTA
ncbi:universal stress protein A-like protein isoform X2 [Corylus avellana]|uniref:universal stress protein A-like protein isoform X2 n=1 Tax=Corylus avellana TaxID=13451 RepID=UPI00286B5E97|nr:universal stress protein A-like protein isoform X2 [Corylus avellana]